MDKVLSFFIAFQTWHGKCNNDCSQLLIPTNQHIMKNTESIIQKQRPDVTALCNEYTDWLVTNLPRDYVVHEDCSAEAILWDSNKLKLNKDQIQWLRNFCMRWDKAYL